MHTSSCTHMHTKYNELTFNILMTELKSNQVIHEYHTTTNTNHTTTNSLHVQFSIRNGNDIIVFYLANLKNKTRPPLWNKTYTSYEPLQHTRQIYQRWTTIKPKHQRALTTINYLLQLSTATTKIAFEQQIF